MDTRLSIDEATPSPSANIPAVAQRKALQLENRERRRHRRRHAGQDDADRRDRRYVGERRSSGQHVVVLEGGDAVVIARDSCWGCHGVATEALARTLLYDATGSGMLAGDWAADLADEVLAHLPPDGFMIDAAELIDWLARPCA